MNAPVVERGAPRRRASTLGLLVAQVRSQLQQFVRLPIALFFTLILPLMMLLLFNSIFGGSDNVIDTPQGEYPVRQFYVGGLAAFSAVSATFTNLANTIPERRQAGILRRWRGTPIPPWLYLAGYVVAAVVIAVVAVVIMLAIGVVLYDTEIELAKLPAAVVIFVVGVASWSALGVAVAGLVRSPESAPAVANGIILPLGFISDTFIPLEDSPGWLNTIGNVFPLKPFAQSMQAAFNPLIDAPAFSWGKIAVVAAWGVLGVVVAARTFKWDPVADRGGGRRRRRHDRGADASASDADGATPAVDPA